MEPIRFSILVLFLGVLSVHADPALHRGPVTAILSVNGNVYSCSQSGVFEGIAEKQKCLVRPDFRVVSLAGKNNSLILGGGHPAESGIVASWHFKDGNLMQQKVADDLAYSVATSGNSIFVALASGDVLQIKNAVGEKPTIRHRHTAAARVVKVSDDGKHLASAGMDRIVLVSNLEKPGEVEPLIIQDHTEGIDCLAFSPDSSRIASGARDGKVRIHFSEGGKLVKTYRGLNGQITALAWGERLFAGTSSGRIYELGQADDRGTLLHDLGPDSPINSLAWVERANLMIGIPDQALPELQLKQNK